MSEPVHSYGDYPRLELLPFVPSDTQLVLDVGCGRGAFGLALKARFPGITVHGIEANPTAFPTAQSRLDRVYAGFYPEVAPSTRFDVIFFNDVLEHLEDPTPALEAARRSASLVIASIPNIRHIDVLADLILQDEWSYVDEGILDRTHLRFYTQKSARDLFLRNGFTVEGVEPINLYSKRRILRHLSRIYATQGFLALQYVIVAKPRCP